MLSSIVVQKFGGSSVADVAKIRLVAARVKARRDTGSQVVVVVSAMGDTTDKLLSLARQIAVDPARRELDMLLSCGERISMALLSMALHELEVPAISFTGSQSGIITDESHSQARILQVRPHRIEESLRQGKVVIVAGYQGVSRHHEVTTLGRGGSDTTAVALAAALGADCEIYSDVDGIYSADPRVVPAAKKLASISYDEMQELACAGAKVLNDQAVEFARERGIVIHARSTHGGGVGTRIEASTVAGRVKGITSESELWVLEPHGQLDLALEWLDAQEIKGRTLVSQAGGAWVVVPLLDVHGPQALKAKLLGEGIGVLEGYGTVTCVGARLNQDWSVLRKARAVAAALGATVFGSYTSALQLTLVVERAHLGELTRSLHHALVEDPVAPAPQNLT